MNGSEHSSLQEAIMGRVLTEEVRGKDALGHLFGQACCVRLVDLSRRQ